MRTQKNPIYHSYVNGALHPKAANKLPSILRARSSLRIRNKIRLWRHVDWPRILHFRIFTFTLWAAHENDDVNLWGGILGGGKRTKTRLETVSSPVYF